MLGWRCSHPTGPDQVKVDFWPGTNDTASISGFLKGQEHGEWRRYHTNGYLMELRFFDQGMKVDTLWQWWDNGQLQSQYVFQDGEYEGTCREWNREGILVREMNYHLGHEEGSQKQWYDDGAVRSNYVIRNGRRYGLLGTKNCVNAKDSVLDN